MEVESTTADPADSGTTDTEIVFEPDGDEPVDDEPVAPVNGKRRRRRDEAKKSEKQSSKGEPEVIEEPGWQDLSAEPEFAEAVEALSKVTAAEPPGFDDVVAEEIGDNPRVDRGDTTRSREFGGRCGGIQ